MRQPSFHIPYSQNIKERQPRAKGEPILLTSPYSAPAVFDWMVSLHICSILFRLTMYISTIVGWLRKPVGSHIIMLDYLSIVTQCLCWTLKCDPGSDFCWRASPIFQLVSPHRGTSNRAAIIYLTSQKEVRFKTPPKPLVWSVKNSSALRTVLQLWATLPEHEKGF